MDSSAWLLFAAGVAIGIAITFIFLTILYLFRLFVFKYVPPSNRDCTWSEVFHTPQEAIDAGFDPKDILSIKNGRVVYTPPPSVYGCHANPKFLVVLTNPPYCTFDDGIVGEEIQSGSGIYKIDTDEFVRAENCVPKSEQKVSTGRPFIPAS